MRAFTLPVAALALALVCGAASRRPQSTSAGKLKPAVAEVQAPVAQAVVETDTLFAGADSLVLLRGYDKPLRGARETLHVTSCHHRTITGMRLEITYNDMQGRMLHRRETELNMHLAPGETTLATFDSWDKNRSYYYARGPQPRTSGVTPYTVSCRVVYLTVKPEN